MRLHQSAILALLAGVFFVLCAGCSHGGTPVAPDARVPTEPAVTGENGSHSLLGMFNLVCEPEKNNLDITPLRGSSFHLNALRFLEPPSNLHLRIAGPIKITGNILDANLAIVHPFLGLTKYTGFDVCGIIFTHGSDTGFHNPDIVMAGPGDTRLLNADGYSRWWNPSEFPHGETMFNYKDGLLGTPSGAADYNCTVNGYKYYADGLEGNTPLSELDPARRGMFSAGQIRTRHYQIDISGGLIFNYAIDACWRVPSGNSPYDAPDDFPEDANRAEAYNINVTEVFNTLFYEDSYQIGGGNLKLSIDVYDHFNCSLNKVYGESLDGLPFVGMTAPVSGNETFSTYELDFHGSELTHAGTGRMLIEVRSEETGYPPVLPEEPLCAYFVYEFDISSENPGYTDGWAVTWGGYGDERGFGVIADSESNLYVTGLFRNTVDFDPGDGELFLTSNGSCDSFICKFNTLGEFQWAGSWGSGEYSSGEGEQGFAIDIDSSENLYVSGYFDGTVDFDPGPGVTSFTANANRDAYLSKFDSDGNFIWVRTWGGPNLLGPTMSCARFVSVDDWDNVYVGGYYSSDVDLDPGPGVDMHINNGDEDIFLSKFTVEGDLIWARSWGGPQSDEIYGLVVNSSGSIFTVGSFSGAVDFDPGPGLDERTSNGNSDVFLCRTTKDGDYISTSTWGGHGTDMAEGVSISSAGDIYIAGNFSNLVDFDPGPGVDEFTSHGNYDVFLTKYNSSDVYQWTLAWGGTGLDDSHMISVRGGNVFVVGHISNTVDMDPTEGEDWRTAHGADMALSKFDSYGGFTWARVWGGYGGEYTRGFASDHLGNLYITGGFSSSPMDFDPGADEDMHYTNGGRDIFLMKMLPNGYW